MIKEKDLLLMPKSKLLTYIAKLHNVLKLLGYGHLNEIDFIKENEQGASMTDKPENPHAFACVAIDTIEGSHLQEGMTLLDYFAGQALQGVLASNANPDSTGYSPDENKHAVRHAYEYAAEMLEERKEYL